MIPKLLLISTVLALGSLLGLRADDVHPLISVTSPAYCSDVQGDTEIDITAPGLRVVTVKSWQAGDNFGSNADVGTINLDDSGKGSIKFPADDFPHGPITVVLSGKKDDNTDNCYLQLYNKGGKSWNEGIPQQDPPGADGMKLVYSDDFDRAPSISSTDSKAKYYDHKPPNGSQDFSSIPFTSYDSPNNPFSHVDTYLRIRADATKNSSGLISSENNDGTGFKVAAPCYFECRFIAPNARGTWPAFWLLSDYMPDFKAGKDQSKEAVDELDIIEAYGGEGQGSPNSKDLYQVTPHAWNQGKDLGDLSWKYHNDMNNPMSMKRVGIPSTWYEAFHTYGCRITPEVTTYYCDNIEIGHHPTLPVSKTAPFYFLINLATGGGWPVDISRYGKVDMYVDWVRVYAQDSPATP
jgi:beta-glucanase (GH16 family)